MAEVDDGTFISFRLNGRPVSVPVRIDESLVETLRRLGEYTVRESCGVGLCGCCTVRLDGKVVSSCLYWSTMADGRDVVTLAGVEGETLAEALQVEIAHHGGAQCGYCTPGMVMTALELLESGQPVGPDEVREHMSGNLCRCACYPQLIEAICATSDTPRSKTYGLSG